MMPTQKNQAFQNLGMPPNESHDLYLGLPAFVGRSKNKVFDGLKQRISKKLQHWRGNLFLMAGREILIKAGRKPLHLTPCQYLKCLLVYAIQCQ